MNSNVKFVLSLNDSVGTLEYNGKHLIALEDMCRRYKNPCVLDCKVGLFT
jgi:hypothetical protein